METHSSASGNVLRGGFQEPVFDAQIVFRQVMNALARPGTICSFEDCAMPPSPLLPKAGAIAATLFDADTTIWLDSNLRQEQALIDWLVFHTAANMVEQTFDANFAVVGEKASLPSLESFSQGTQEYPDRSTTVILQIDKLTDGSPLELTGPGIKNSRMISPQGLPSHFCEQWADNRARFPRGVDVLLVASEGIIGLPRTTIITKPER